MKAKIYKLPRAKVRGLPEANVAVSPGVVDGVPQVLAILRVLDVFEIPDTAASLRINVAEARDLAKRLILAADQAEAMAADLGLKKEKDS